MSELATINEAAVFKSGIDWLRSNDPVPTTLTEEEWTAWVTQAGVMGRHLAWRLADLLAFGQDRWGETYYTLIERTGFAPGYVAKIEGWGRRGLPETRREVIAALPSAENIPHAWWEAVGPITDDNGKKWHEAGSNRREILHNRQLLIERGLALTEPDGSRISTEKFTAFVRSFRGIVSSTDRHSAEPPQLVVNADAIDDETEWKVMQESLLQPLIPVSDCWEERLSPKCRAQLEVLSRYYQTNDLPFVIATAIDQFFQIRKARLAKYEEPFDAQ